MSSTDKESKYALVRGDRVHEPVFRPVMKGGKKERFEVQRDLGDKELNIVGPDLLGEDDADLYFTILSKLARDGGELHPEPEHRNASDVWEKLEAEKQAEDKATLVAYTTIHELLNEMGKKPDGADSYEAVRNSLDRMRRVTVEVYDHDQDLRYGMKMLSYTECLEDERSPLMVSIDSRAAAAIMPEGALTYRKLNLDERRALESDKAKSLHKTVSIRTNAGSSIKSEIDKLADSVWRGYDELPASTQRSRRSMLKDALDELEDLIDYDYEIRGRGGDAMVKIWRAENDE
jgi:hypothetical protein